MLKMIDEAYLIAKNSLRSNYDMSGIKTGSLRDTYWSWDSFFASFGSLELGDRSIVKTNFETFLSLQDNEGCLPRRISSTLFFYHLKFLTGRFHPDAKVPSYSASPFFAKPRLQNLVFLISFANYIRKTKDLRFLRHNIGKIIKTLSFIETSIDSRGLLNEPVFCNWSETILKKGEVLFTNVLYAKSLEEMSFLHSLLGKPASLFDNRSKRVKEAINSRFWNGSYYADFIDDNRRSDIFSADGNLFASLFNICDGWQAELIQKKLLEFNMDHLPTKTNHPKYTSRDIFFLNWFVNRDYHNGASWLWLGCVSAVVKSKLGKKEEAEKIMYTISEIIKKDGTVCELHNGHGQPYRNYFYSAEKNFAWGAGLYIWAFHKIFKTQKHD